MRQKQRGYGGIIMRVKICGITNTEDAKRACDLGADALGFVFYPGSPRHVTAAQAQAIVAQLPPFVTAVGLFVNATQAFVDDVLAEVPLDILQFHGDETPAYCQQFQRAYIKAVRVDGMAAITQAMADYPDARALLFDAHVAGSFGGTGQAFDWTLLPNTLNVPWVLSGGLNVSNIEGAVLATQAQAVDVSSGVEREKGLKCPEKMAEFIRGAKRAGL